jgi:hypothetical protein
MKKQLLVLSLLAINIMMAQIPSYVPTNGLVGYYPFNGNANDESGTGNNGAVYGAILTSDRFGNANKAYSFNGNSSYIEVISTPSISFTNSYTLSGWFFANDFNGINGQYNRAILSKTISTGWYGGYDLMIGTSNSQGYIYHSGNINSNFQLNAFGYNVGNWYMVTATFDGNIINLYMNGILITSENRIGNIQYGTEPLHFGRRSGGGIYDQWLNGNLDDFGLWNRALTQEEITSLYLADTTCQSLVINTGILSFNPVTYNNTVTIYPNPANDHVTIDCGNLANVTGYQIKIVNTLGQEVFSGAMNTQQYVVPLNTWSGAGVYFVKIYDASNNLLNTKKIILQ